MGASFRYLCAAVVMVLSFCPASGQVVIQGTLLNEGDKTPISFANIGILNTSVGTISNQDGTFEVRIPEKHVGDTLLFSALGFQKKWFLVRDLIPKKKPLTILLEEQTTILRNITVKSKKRKPLRSFQLGNELYTSGSLYVDSVAAGSAMALLIENRYPNYNPELTIPFFVRKARLRISYNTFDDFKIRLRFLSVNKDSGLPDKDLFNGSIIVTSRLRKGWLTFDLSNYNVRIDEPAFFLVFEWLIEDDDRQLLMELYREFERQFPKKVTTDSVIVEGEQITFHSYHGYRAGTSFGSASDRSVVDNFKCYYRNNSHGQWKRSSTILAANVVVVNY